MARIPKLSRLVHGLGVALFLAAGVQRAPAFALLGPFAPWMTAPLIYRQTDAIGGPMNIGEGYRWNVPVVTYGYDKTFLDYFGSNGVAAVESAVQILNNLPPSSQIVLTNYLLVSSRVNLRTQAEDLVDLKSAALVELVEQMGLAQPVESVFALRSFSFHPADNSADYTVEMRNYNPVGLAPSTFVNSAMFGYTVYFHPPQYSAQVIVYANGNSSGFIEQFGQYIPPGYANIQEYNVDPRTSPNRAVAEYEPGPLYGLNLGAGQFIFNGLTRDDVGGLAYLLNTNTIALESLLPDVTGTGTNAGNFVNRALRPGMDKITFQRIDALSTDPQVFPIVTNQYVDSYLTNGVVQQQTLQRVITQPDILFTVSYIGLDIVSRTGTTNWVNNGAPLNDGPGVIQPPIVINFNRFGPSWEPESATYTSPQVGIQALPFWGSLDSTTNPPVVYPTHPATTNSTEFHFFLFQGSSTPISIVWNISGAPGALFSLQTATNLSDWVTIGTITNLGGTFTYEDQIYRDTPQRYFRTVPQ